MRQELMDAEIKADEQEIAVVLSGLLAEKAITQADFNQLMKRNHAQPIPRA